MPSLGRYRNPTGLGFVRSRPHGGRKKHAGSMEAGELSRKGDVKLTMHQRRVGKTSSRRPGFPWFRAEVEECRTGEVDIIGAAPIASDSGR